MKKIINKALFSLIILILISCGGNSKTTETQKIDTASQTIQKIVGIGKVEPLNGLVDLASNEGGMIQKINKKEGDSVKNEELILSFNTEKEKIQLQKIAIQISIQKQRIKQDQATEKQLEAELREKVSALKISEELVQSGAETRQNIEILRKEQDVLTANLEAAQENTLSDKLKIQELQNEIKQLTQSTGEKSIKAPANGVLVSLNAEIGKVIEPYTPIGQFAADEPLVIHGEVDELFADKIRIGQPVSIHLIGNSEEIAKGKVMSVSPILQNKSLFYDKPGETSDRRVRRFKVNLDISSNLLINKKVECIIYL